VSERIPWAVSGDSSAAADELARGWPFADLSGDLGMAGQMHPAWDEIVD
jgi:hypothetical protein